MNPKFTITRYPNSLHATRGPNMAIKTYQKCLEEKTHGYWLYDGETLKESIFICDDCFNMAKKESK